MAYKGKICIPGNLIDSLVVWDRFCDEDRNARISIRARDNISHQKAGYMYATFLWCRSNSNLAKRDGPYMRQCGHSQQPDFQSIFCYNGKQGREEYLSAVPMLLEKA